MPERKKIEKLYSWNIAVLYNELSVHIHQQKNQWKEKLKDKFYEKLKDEFYLHVSCKASVRKQDEFKTNYLEIRRWNSWNPLEVFILLDIEDILNFVILGFFF